MNLWSSLKQAGRNPKLRGAALMFAAFAFFGGLAVALWSQPNLLSDLNWLPILVVLAAIVPAILLINAVEFVLSARLVDKSFHLRHALEITLAANAANLLPIPGSALVRVAGLKAAGSSLSSGAIATGYVSVIWVGVSALAAGLAATSLGHALVGLICASIGAIILLVATTLVAVLFRKVVTPLMLLGLKTLIVLLDAIRILMCFWALGETITLMHALVLSVSSVIGAAISIVPAGLGVREASGVLLASAIALPASATFVALSLSRILGLAIVAPLSALLGARSAMGQTAGATASADRNS